MRGILPRLLVAILALLLLVVSRSPRGSATRR
jgi:hypothetical protein